MKQRNWHLTALALTLVLGFAAAAGCGGDPGAKPNFVIILTDDQGWGDLSLTGNTNLATPRIDSLAQEGAMFDRFYVCPVCSPTRAEFLTGRYYPRGGVSGTSSGEERLDLDERTIAETFQAGGYATGAFGKWHNGSQHPYHPNARGFQEFYGFTSGHWGNYFDPMLEHNDKIVRGTGFIIDDLTDHAIDFIEENRERPFFCYIPYNTPHSPMQVPDRFYEKFANADLRMRNRDPEQENLAHTRAALAMCENIDWNVGRVLDALEELKLADNTVVIYFSDNGPNGWRWNGDMKGRKGSIDEGGVRSPFLIRWPGRIPAGARITEIAGAIDLLPTLADLAGIPVVGDKPLDGVSLKPLLLGEANEWPEREILSFRLRGGEVSVRNQRFRLDAQGRLFDIAADPGQRTDVAARHPDVAARLREVAERKGKPIAAEAGKDTRPYPVGYAASTWLPVRDAVSAGHIQRSNHFPNSSYFTNWVSTEDKVIWDVEVGRAGDYEAIVYYTCAAENVGSVVRLSFLGNSMMGVISEANESPLIGAEHDRVERTESYDQNYKPLSLGVIALEAGRGELVMQAAKIAGKQVMDLRALMLARTSR